LFTKNIEPRVIVFGHASNVDLGDSTPSENVGDVIKQRSRHAAAAKPDPAVTHVEKK
jgi:hypothetical protein